MSDVPSPEAPQPEPASRLDDYVDIFVAPKEVFERRLDGLWGQALLVLIVVSVALYYVFLPAAEIMADASMAQVIAENPEAAEGMAQMQAVGGTMLKLGGIMVILSVGASVLLLGGVIKVISSAFGAALTFAQALVVATFARFVLIPRTLATDLSLLWADRGGEVDIVTDTSFGPLRFVDSASLPDLLIPFLQRFDVFALWEAALWAVGVYVIARTTKGSAVAVAAITLLLAAIPGVIGALMS